MTRILICDNCRRTVTDQDQIDLILAKRNEFDRKHIFRKKPLSVGECPFTGCYGEVQLREI